MKKRIVLLGCLVFVMLLVSVGFSYSWYVSNDAGGFTASAGKINGEILFTQSTNVGIPDETLVVSDKNSLKNKGTNDFIYKLTYTIAEDSNANISKIKLDSLTGFNLVMTSDYNSNDKSVSYLGKINGDTAELPDLLANFNKVKNENKNNTFRIRGTVLACQASKTAVMDVFNLTAEDLVSLKVPDTWFTQ